MATTAAAGAAGSSAGAAPIELSQLTTRRLSASGAVDLQRSSAFQMTPLVAGDGVSTSSSADVASAGTSAGTSSGVDPGMTAPSRRPSRSDAARPAFGITPIIKMEPPATADDTDDDGAAPAPAESLAQRRMSRSQSIKDLQPPPLVLRHSPRPLDTPPADGGIMADPFAPVPGPSLPPTPNERAFDDMELGTPSDPGMRTPGDTPPADGDDAAVREFFPSLPPVDRGREAYMFLGAATVLETMIWGLPFSVGVLHEYWGEHMFPEAGAEGMLTLASTLPTGLLFLSGAILGPLFAAYPWYERHIQYGGVVVATAGLLLSAFVTKPWQLVITFGILLPCSGATYLPCATNMFEWFQLRLGLATGLMYSGTGFGGTVYPLVTEALLKRFGYRATMLALAITFLVVNLAAMPFVRRRIPITHLRGGERKRHERPRIDLSFLRSPTPWVAFTFMFVTSLANFLPLLWLPTFATLVNVRRPNGAALLALTNAITAVGQLLSGCISDILPARDAVIVSTTLASVSVLLFWGLGTNVAMLTLFAISWGLTGGSLAGYWGKMIKVIARDDPTVTIISFSLFITLKGIGSLTSGPISNRLLEFAPFPGALGAYGATNYAVMIVFTAVMTSVGGWVLLFFPRK